MGEIDEARAADIVLELNRSATVMRLAQSEDRNDLEASAVVSRLGQGIADVEGVQGMRRIHGLLDPDIQRTAELQWYAIEDANGFKWLP